MHQWESSFTAAGGILVRCSHAVRKTVGELPAPAGERWDNGARAVGRRHGRRVKRTSGRAVVRCTAEAISLQWDGKLVEEWHAPTGKK